MIMSTVFWLAAICWAVAAFFVSDEKQLTMAILSAMFMIGSVIVEKLDKIERKCDE